MLPSRSGLLAPPPAGRGRGGVGCSAQHEKRGLCPLFAPPFRPPPSAPRSPWGLGGGGKRKGGTGHFLGLARGRKGRATKRSDWRDIFSVRVRGADSALPVLGEANRPGAAPRVRDR